jgi:CRP-like cAMP-binding protein
VSLLELDPDLGERLSPGERDEVRRLVLARVIALPRGLLRAPAYESERSALHGLLLLDGLVSRSIALADTTTVELLGHGDLLEPTRDMLSGRLVPIGVSWTVLEPTEAIVIDDDLLRSAQRWPQLLAALFERVAVQTTRLATRCAISQLARVEERLEMLLWFLAERWGRVGRDGVVLPLRLTHELIGQMLGAKRPTVSLAVRALEHEGRVRRRVDGAWLLLPPPEREPALLEPRAGGGVRRIELRERPHADADAPAFDRHAVQTEHAAWMAGSQLQARIERLRVLHTNTQLRVNGSLREAERTRSSSEALRQRLTRERDRPRQPTG